MFEKVIQKVFFETRRIHRVRRKDIPNINLLYF